MVSYGRSIHMDRVYATSWKHMVRVQTISGDSYLLSPAEPEIFQENCQEMLGICK